MSQSDTNALPKCRTLLRPRSIAVVGASDRPGPGQRVVSNLRAAAFNGMLYPVNPKRDNVCGIPAYPALALLPEVPDLVVAAVNRDAAVDAIAEAAQLGARAAVLLGAGYGEADEDGRRLECRLRELSSSMALMGPNCLGYVNLEDGIAPYSGPLMEPPTCGNVAIVSNSGALACTLTGVGAERDINFSHVITTGNQIDLTVADYVQYLASRPVVRVIACYIEGFHDGRALLTAFDEARQAGKHVIVLKGGSSRVGGDAARTHTGALAGSAALQQSIWSQHRVLQAHDLEEMFALIALCSRTTVPEGARIGVITISGGERLLLADRAEALDIPLAPLSEPTHQTLSALLPIYATVSNPLDTTGAGLVEGDGRVHAEASRVLALDPSVDLVLISQDIKNGWVQTERQANLFWDALRATWGAVSETGKPVVLISPTTGQVDERAREFIQAERIPFVLGLQPGMAALAALVRPVDGAESRKRATRHIYGDRSAGRALTGQDALRYLAARGVPEWPSERVHSAEEAVAAAERLGYPVVLKLDTPGLLHKTEVGGVIVGVRGAAQVEAAWRELMARGTAAVEAGVVVQRMAEGGVELFAGGMRDQQFGPVLLLGVGGTLAEFIHDTEVGLAPLNAQEAEKLIESTRAAELLDGWRGTLPADRNAIVQALVSLSHVIAEPGVRAFDVNPLIALPDGIAIVDATLILEGDAG